MTVEQPHDKIRISLYTPPVMQAPDEYAHDVYERTLATLDERAAKPGFDIAAVTAEYDALTVYQGHGWDGRNAYKDAEIEGQIDAYQIFLHRHGSPEDEN